MTGLARPGRQSRRPESTAWPARAYGLEDLPIVERFVVAGDQPNSLARLLEGQRPVAIELDLIELIALGQFFNGKRLHRRDEGWDWWTVPHAEDSEVNRCEIGAPARVGGYVQAAAKCLVPLLAGKFVEASQHRFLQRCSHIYSP